MTNSENIKLNNQCSITPVQDTPIKYAEMDGEPMTNEGKHSIGNFEHGFIGEEKHTPEIILSNEVKEMLTGEAVKNLLAENQRLKELLKKMLTGEAVKNLLAENQRLKELLKNMTKITENFIKNKRPFGGKVLAEMLEKNQRLRYVVRMQTEWLNWAFKNLTTYGNFEDDTENKFKTAIKMGEEILK